MEIFGGTPSGLTSRGAALAVGRPLSLRYNRLSAVSWTTAPSFLPGNANVRDCNRSSGTGAESPSDSHLEGSGRRSPHKAGIDQPNAPGSPRSLRSMVRSGHGDG